MKQVLKAYEEALRVCKDLDFYKALDYLFDNNLELGICDFCVMTGIENEILSVSYITKLPWYCNNHSEIIESLEFRINFLKQLS
jgi:hypothetical protein